MQYAAGRQDNESHVETLKEIIFRKYHELKMSSGMQYQVHIEILTFLPAGSHSPSALALQKAIPEISLKIDCCFLS